MMLLSWFIVTVVLLCAAQWLDREERAQLQDGNHTKTQHKLPKHARWIEWDRMRKYVIADAAGVPYMTRWVILSTKWGELKLHKFHRSDADRDLHDHPWNFWSLILWGGYYEETTLDTYYALPSMSRTIRVLPSSWPAPDRVQAWYRAGSLLHRKAEHAHRVVLEERWVTCTGRDHPYEGCDRAGYTHEHNVPREAWTLIWTQYPRRKWGFYTICGWQAWRDYLGKKAAKTPICE